MFADVRKLWFIKTFWNCRSLRNSFFCNVLQEGSKQRHGIISIRNDRLVQTSAAWMLELIPVCPCQLPSLNPFKTRRSIVLKQDGKDIVFCWVPNHTGIKGNEKADSAAKSALDLPRAKVGVPYNDFKHIDQYIFSTWQDDWNGAVAKKLHSVKPVLGDWQSSYRRCRKDEVVLCRARIGHTHLTHSYIYLEERSSTSV